VPFLTDKPAAVPLEFAHAGKLVHNFPTQRKKGRTRAMLPSSSSKLKLSFDTVFYYVTDIHASIAFYRDTLGLPMVSHDYVARFDLDGVLIELIRRPPGSVVPGNGNARLCFSVANLQETLAQMHARGIATSDIKNKKGGKLAFFRDPDDNELCLWEYAETEDAREIVKLAVLQG
jgi:catechol 2,3-dioxygenase-like lactoylglutathione lyase family enzyme